MTERIFKTVGIVFIFTNLFVLFAHPIIAITQDLGRHLLLGKIIVETYSIPKTNLFSYTYPHFPFINTHWLSEVMYYLFFQLFGYTSVLLLTISCMLLAFGIIFFYALRKSSMTVVAIISFFALGILAERTDVRPEVFSFLFLSLFVTILYRAKEKKTKLIFLLPFLQFLWVNMHIYFILGILVVCLFGVDAIISHRRILFLWIKKKTPVSEKSITTFFCYYPLSACHID